MKSESSESSVGNRGSAWARLRQRISDPNIWRIYVTTLLLGAAYGIAISVIALFLDSRGYGKAVIGELAACFALGIVAFSIPMGAFIRRFSAKRVLIWSLLGYAATVSGFPFLQSLPAIAGLRFFDGAFSVGIWVSSETILLARADRHNKAFVTSIYAISMAVGYVLGPFAAHQITQFFPLFTAFIAAGVLALVAALFAGARLDADDGNLHAEKPAAEIEPTATMNAQRRAKPTKSLLWRIKTSCFGAFAYGYFQSSVVLFLPLYLIESKGIERAQTITIPAYFALGMLLFSNYAGRLGDKFGHLLLMRILGGIGMTMILGFVYLSTFPAMCAAVFVAGASLAAISPVSLALQGVIAEPHEYSRSTAIYNVFYAAGMLLGPPVSSWLFAHHGGGVMLFHLALLWFGFVLFTLLFFRDDPAATTASSRPAPLTQDSALKNVEERG